MMFALKKGLTQHLPWRVVPGSRKEAKKNKKLGGFARKKPFSLGKYIIKR